MDAVHVILATTPGAMDIHRMGSVKGVSLCMFTSTRRSPDEELKTQTSSWSEFPEIVKKAKPMIRSQALKLELNHELSSDNSVFSSCPALVLACDQGLVAGCFRLCDS